MKNSYIKSMLFMPGHKIYFLDKLKKSISDAITIDLEDSVPINKKDVARKNLNKFDGFIALGCVIKGQTPHFDLICKATFNAIMSLSITYNKPIGNGIITALNSKQAYERCGIKKSNKQNKGLEAAKAVLSVLKNGPKKV